MSDARRSLSPTAERMHPGAWMLWLLSAMVAVLLTSNPLYLATIGLSAIVVYAGVRTQPSRALDALLVFGWLFASATIPLNLLGGSTGETELLSLPALVLPGWLGSVSFGGDVTAESLVYATSRALAVAAIVSIVCAFNAGVDHFQLLRLTPPGLAQLGVVISVGLLLVPETIARATSLREARRTRGRSDGVFASITLILPLLSDALERAVQRAESIDARGFGALAARARTVETGLSIGGLLLASIGAFAWYYAPDDRLGSGAAFVLGGFAVALMVWRQSGRGTGRRLFVPALRRNDVVVAACAALALGMIAGIRIADVGDVTYLPFPALHAPSYHFSVAGAGLLLLAPVLAVGGKRE